MKLDFRQRLLATTLLVGAGMIATPAFAQDTTQTTSPPDNAATPTIPETTTPQEGQTAVTTSAEGETIESAQDVVVTGTRIPQPNLESASPVTVVTAQEVKLQGTSRTEDLINSLPQSFAAQGSNISNGSTGIASVNLRGLGTQRTMVLVNGRRLHPGDPRTPVADINFIPSALIKRVDVLTGGASSVYGADAVAGVVNFILDTNFRGLRIDGQASAFMHDNDTNEGILAANAAAPGGPFNPPKGMSVNGGAMDLAVAFGAGFDDNRGNVTAYATYRKQRAVLQSTRDYSYCALSALTDAQVTATGRRFGCAGSATSAVGSFFTNVGTFQVQGTSFVPGTTPFNYNPYNYYQRPDERYTLGAFAEYEINEMFTPYLEAMFMDDRSDAEIAPSGNFFNTTTLNCDNPLLSAQQRGIICAPANLLDADGDGAPDVFTDPATGATYNQAVVYTARRNVEGGARRDDLRHQAFRIVGGLRGDITNGLSYNAYYSYGNTSLTEVFERDFSITRIGRALDVVDDPDAAGVNPICRSALIARNLGATAPGADPNCVPWNIFATGGVTPAALNYLQVPGHSSGDVSQEIAQIDFTVLGSEYGIQSPWSDRGIGLNVGAGYTKNKLDYKVDQAFQTGDLAGQGGPTVPVSGSYDVRELFGEVEVPIISNSFVEELTFRGGYRYSDYKIGDNSFSTDTYKLEAEFAPVPDIRLRGSYNRAVRAPNVVELFSPQRVALQGTIDPCAGTTPTASLAQCQLTGVTAAQYGTIQPNPAGQYNGFIGGNPNLSPETADTYTVGLVLQPRFVPGLAVTLDYFDIDVKDAIGVIGFNTILNQCLQSGDPFFCDRITRAQPSGSLWLSPTGFITDLNENLGGLHTSGMDAQASYARRLGGMGTLNLSFVGTWLKDLDVSPFEGIEYDCASFYGLQCITPSPKWRHKFRVGFTLPNGIGISGQWRYFSSVKSDVFSDDTDLAGTSRQANAKLNAQSYFDLALQARLADRFNFRLGANNLFDKEPPVAASAGTEVVINPPFGNGNTYPQVYDSLGRYIFAGFTVDF